MGITRNSKKRQHYVPQFYLRGFQYGANKVFAYDKGTGKIVKKLIPSFCQENYLYESELGDSVHCGRDYVAPGCNEDRLASMERDFSTMLHRVISLSESGTSFTCVSKDDAEMLSLFVANMIVRNPEILHPLQDELNASVRLNIAPYRSLMEMFGIGFAFEGVVNEAINRVLLLGKDDGSFQRSVANGLNEMEGVLICAPKDAPFITASFPVFPAIKELGGMEHLASLYFPLCSYVAIIYGSGKNTGIQRCISVDAGTVDKLNAACLGSGYGQFLIAESREALERALASEKR